MGSGVKFPLFQAQAFQRQPFPSMSAAIARAKAQIMAEEDRRIFEDMDLMMKCDDDGTGVCRRCFLPVQEACPMWSIEGIMES